jgi:hypothetical protein
MVSLADIYISRSDKADVDGEEGAPADIGPIDPGQNERRLSVQAYNHWLSLVLGEELPAIEDLHLGELGDMAARGVLFDLTLGAASPSIIFLGAELTAECGKDIEIFSIRDVPSRSLLSQLAENCLEVAATRAPAGFDVGFTDHAGHPILARGMLLPFSSNGKIADFVFGVISWKLVPAQSAP